MWRLGLILMAIVGLMVCGQPAMAQPFVMEFSLDIGSDCELSDPNFDGDEAFDPGDVYWDDGSMSLPPPQNGQKDDMRLFAGADPWPDPMSPGTHVPITLADISAYYDYFDLDGHDQLDFSLTDLVPPGPAQPILQEYFSWSNTVFEPMFLAISYDDDQDAGWPVIDVPVTKSSMTGAIYGMTGADDEVIEVDLMPLGGGMYQVMFMMGIADEVRVHSSLAPNPGSDETDDDDVDSLDVVESPDTAWVWLFSVDHEARMQLDPGDIYEEVGGAAVKVIDHAIHLGLQDGVDIDAFEFAWVQLDDGAGKALALLFSVDQDDPLTPNAIESGMKDPTMIYYSFLNGTHQPLLQEPLMDDVDALTNWRDPMIPEEEIDWGDAPDGLAAPKYPTYMANNGAHHLIVPNMFLGASVDGDPDGQPDATATGDDNDGNDDEDGVTLVTTPIVGGVCQIDVVASTAGILSAWVDLDQDGKWVASEQVIVDQAVVAGNNTFFVAVPAGSMTGPTFARFRYSSVAGLTPDGPAPDGEVEDYAVTIEGPVDLVDFGDAPDGAVAPQYLTLLANNGPRHQIVPGFMLGALIDAENDGQPHPQALGDDLAASADEDGVVLNTPLTPGMLAVLTVTATGGGLLQGWVDLNANGTFADAGEQVITNWPLANGPNPVVFNVPLGAAVGPTFARFRFSTLPNLGIAGYASDGEVEDYQVTITQTGQATDWGDAPDPPYPTLAASGGANHIINWNMFLGASIDPELDGQPTFPADGDDLLDGNDDEDGVNMPSNLVPNTVANVTVVASMAGLLQGWVDFNFNGSWADPGEQVFVDAALVPGPNTLTFNVPNTGYVGVTYARFRYSTQRGLTFVGQAPDGEVEDYETHMDEPQYQIDWGDAPDQPYPTLAANLGANHIIVAGMMMGGRIDAEPDGQPVPPALGDDLTNQPDEDGVVLTSSIIPGGVTTVTVTVTVSGVLNAWMDFNQDGDWADPGEQIFTDKAVNPPANNLSFSVPASAIPGVTYSRWRYSTQRGLSYTGSAQDGEVEDYENYIEEPQYEWDWGDAPDWPYPTLAANNGANHMIVPGMMMGALIDGEPDGQPVPPALGDDINNLPDEDGVILTSPMFPGSMTSVTVTVTAPGLLNAWVDFNNNGAWGDVPGEQIFMDQPVFPPANNLMFFVPPWAVQGPTFSRWRYSTMGGLQPAGTAPDGEVEDYENYIEELMDLDFGDAPDPLHGTPGEYPTLRVNDGARHIAGANLFMGGPPDVESDGQPTILADGDDMNGAPDEDGVVFLTPLVFGQTAKVDVIASGPGFVDAWVDFNVDGDWADPGEQIAMAFPVNPGSNVIAFPVPNTPMGSVQISYARFRISSVGGLATTGLAQDGEVEDWMVHLESPGSIRGTKWWDLNADGVHAGAEPAMGGWTIFIDAFPYNGVLDVGETSMVTGAAGQYSFTNLAPGVHHVCEVAQTYWLLTNPASFHTVVVNSGQNVVGKDFLNWMIGDYDGDQDVDGDDITALGLAVSNGLTNSIYDVDGDGDVDWDDYSYIVTQLVFVNGDPTSRGTCFGDIDLDGDVDLDDFMILKINFGTGSTWSQGDLDGDGDVDLDDFVLLKLNFGSTGC